SNADRAPAGAIASAGADFRIAGGGLASSRAARARPLDAGEIHALALTLSDARLRADLGASRWGESRATCVRHLWRARPGLWMAGCRAARRRPRPRARHEQKCR